MYRLFITSFISLFVFAALARSQKPLTPEDEKYIKSQAAAYIKQFKLKIQELGSSDGQKLSDKERNTLINSIDSYFEDTATVQVMNLNKKKNTYSLRNYLSNVVANYSKRYQIVILRIETTNFNVSDLVPIKDASDKITSYKCYYTFVQGFCAKKTLENKEDFDSKDPDDYDVCERTWKSGEVVVKRAFSATKGDRWVISLGDIKANHIKDLQSQ